MSAHQVRWFNGRSCVGVVRVNEYTNGSKYYIGVGNGEDEEQDIEFIAAWGSKFPNDAGDVLFGVGQ